MTAAATSGLAARLADVLAVDPSADAVEFQGRWRTWGDLTHTVERVAALVERPGTQVGILLRNRPACIGALLGVLRAGGCVVAINPGRGEERTRDDVAALDLALIVGEPDDLARFVPEDLPATRVAVADLGTSVDVERAAACAPPEAKEGGTAACAPPEARDRPGVAVRMLTSGTTGPPKRIDLSYPTLERVLVGAKHYESDQDGAVRLRRGVAVVNSPLVHLGGLFRVLQ